MTRTEFALAILAGLSLLVAYRALNTRRLSKSNAKLTTTVALLDARNERLGESNARLRLTVGLAPRGSRPVPEPEQTLTLPRDPSATQRIPAHKPPTRTARHGDGT